MLTSWNKDGYFPLNQLVVTPSDSVNFPDERPVYCNAAGNVACVDKNGTVVVYTVTAGQFLPVQAMRVNATNTTVAAGSLVQVW